MVVEEACNRWHCKNVQALELLSPVNSDSQRKGTDLRFHHMHCSFAVTEGSYSVLKSAVCGIRSVFLM